MNATPDKIRPDKSQLRYHLRRARRAVRGYQRSQQQRSIIWRLGTLPILRTAQRIGGYMAFDGEPDLSAFLRARIETIWLPRINRDLTLHFRPAFDLSTRHKIPHGAKRNRFGILESQRQPRIHARALDILLIPLVGFDHHGNRLGMGAGFYDRSLSGLRHPRPVLVGIAFGCQQIEQLPTDPWDIPLDYIVTNHRIIKVRFRPRRMPQI